MKFLYQLDGLNAPNHIIVAAIMNRSYLIGIRNTDFLLKNCLYALMRKITNKKMYES